MIIKTKNLISLIAIQIVVFMSCTNTVMAAACKSGTECLKQGTSKQVMQILQISLNILSAIVVLAAVIMLIVAGIQYTASNGDPQAIAAAKKKISNVLMGIFAFIFLYAFLDWLIPGGIFEI
jgi:hypothetical protein